MSETKTKKNIKYSYNRILEISEDHKQITMPDSRYYRRNGEYYPSITYVLQSYPKGIHFENWLKQVGYSSEYIVKKAQEEGTLTHELIESYLNGEELNFLSPTGYPQYDPTVWQMLLRFVDWWEEYKPKLVEAEVHLFSDELKVAGTTDLVCIIDHELWIIDFKTSNHIHTTYELQVAAYAQCYKECFGKTIDRMGILHLKSSTRKSSKNKMQGKGWQMLESQRSFEENLEIFKNVKKIHELENPTASPSFEHFVTTVKRKI